MDPPKEWMFPALAGAVLLEGINIFKDEMEAKMMLRHTLEQRAKQAFQSLVELNRPREDQMIDITNRWLVSGSPRDGIVIHNPPHQLTCDQALVFAAHLVTVAEDGATLSFDTIRLKVESEEG